MKKYVTLLIAAGFFCSCASTHHSHRAIPIAESKGAEVSISTELNKKYSDDSHVYFDVIIENRSSQWVRIDQVEVEFLDGEELPHNIVVGNDINHWAESYRIRKQKENFNSDLGIAALILTGAVLMVAAAGTGRSSGGGAMLASGATLYGAGATAGAVKAHNQARDKVMNSVMVPENHLLAPITIPSNGFSQRWILINVPRGRVANYARLKLKSIEGLESSYKVALGAAVRNQASSARGL